MASKRLRFEVFKRDEFTCQYCGRRPPEVVLELDHIHPRAAGGKDDEINLVTACVDCNRGKSDKKLGDIHPRPDVDLKFLEVQQELAEAARYLKASEELAQIRQALIGHLSAIWQEAIADDYIPTDKQWNFWLIGFSPEEIEFAIRRTGGKYSSGQFGYGERGCSQAIRYASGILNNVRRQQAEGVQ